MKIIPMLIALAMGLVLVGCAEQPLMTDEDYYAHRGPAPNSPDPMSHIPNQSSSITGH
jgi:hypothetical protein